MAEAANLASLSEAVEIWRNQLKQLNNQGDSRIQACFMQALRQLNIESVRDVKFRSAYCVSIQNPYHLLCPKIVVETFINCIESESNQRAPQNEANNPSEQSKRKRIKGPKIAINLSTAELKWTELTPVKFSKISKMLGFFKKLQHKNDIVTNGSPLLKQLKGALAGPITRLVAFDVEAFERDSRTLLELGAAIYEVSANGNSGGLCAPSIVSFHFIMFENVRKENGRYCANNRDNFSFGQSEIKPTNQVLTWLREQLEQPGTAIVGHNIKSDLRFLREARVHGGNKGIDKALRHLNGIFDTQSIFQEMQLKENPSKLSAIMDHYGISHAFLHNAGNDAYYTMVAILKMADLPFANQKPNPTVEPPQFFSHRRKH